MLVGLSDSQQLRKGNPSHQQLTWDGPEAGVIEELLGTGSGQQLGASGHIEESAFWGVEQRGLRRVQQLPGGVRDLLGSNQKLLGRAKEVGGV